MKEERKERKRYILENDSVKKRRRPELLEICRGRSRPVSIYAACIFADTCNTNRASGGERCTFAAANIPRAICIFSSLRKI